jgi:hypothetical protein
LVFLVRTGKHKEDYALGMERKADIHHAEEVARNAALKKQRNPEPSYEEKRFLLALEALTANMALDELDVLEAIARRHCPELHEKIDNSLREALSVLYYDNSLSLPPGRLSREELSYYRREVHNYLMRHSTPKSPAKSLPRKRHGGKCAFGKVAHKRLAHRPAASKSLRKLARAGMARK